MTGRSGPLTTHESLHDLLDPVSQKHALPALAAVVVLGGKLVSLGAVGVCKLGDETPVSAGDKFHLGTFLDIRKPFGINGFPPAMPRSVASSL